MEAICTSCASLFTDRPGLRRILLRRRRVLCLGLIRRLLLGGWNVIEGEVTSETSSIHSTVTVSVVLSGRRSHWVSLSGLTLGDVVPVRTE